jgi:hypothetical protein
MSIYVIDGIESLKGFSELKSYDKIQRLSIIGYDDISKLRMFTLHDIPADAGILLEFIDCQYPLEKIIDDLSIQEGAVTTVRYKFTREYQKPVNTLSCRNRRLPFERLVIDFGAKIDCEELRIHQLVLYNLLSASNLPKTIHIDTLVVVHSYNQGDTVFELPQAKTLVIPESQEFKYETLKTKIPDVIGIIPSSYYPSRFATGIQRAREPISKSVIPEVIYEVFSQSHS